MSQNKSAKKLQEPAQAPLNPDTLADELSYEQILQMLEKKKLSAIEKILADIDEQKEIISEASGKIDELLEKVYAIDPTRRPAAKRNRGNGTGGTKNVPPKNERDAKFKLLHDLIAEGKYDRKGIIEKLQKAFPDHSKGSIVWLPSYALNEKYYIGKEAMNPFRHWEKFASLENGVIVFKKEVPRPTEKKEVLAIS